MTTWLTPTRCEKDGWSRLARAAYADGHNSVGHRFSVAASHAEGRRMEVPYFDMLQSQYRDWLNYDEMPEA